MLSKPRHLASAISLCLLSSAASAQTIQPGLWESTSKMQGGSGEMGKAMAQSQEKMANMSPEQRKAMAQAMSPENQKAMMAQMQKQMAGMPPEQRKAMEQAMAAQSTMSMSVGSDGSMAMKTCITQEMIDRKNWMPKTDGKCTQTVSAAVGNTQKFGFTCTDPASSGEGTVTFLSKTSYTSSMKINAVRNGKPESMVFESSAKFLGADCGAVKPVPTK
jgi:Protein of unknown function (DUF3617)